MRERFSSFTKVSILSVLIAIIGFVPGLPGLSLFTETASAATVTLFSDGFNDDSFDAWDTPSPSNWDTVSGNASEGTHRADSSGNSVALTKTINTTGYENIRVTFDYKRVNMESSDNGIAIYNSGAGNYFLGNFPGTGTTDAEGLTDATWQSYDSQSVIGELGGSADNPSFQIKFRSQNSALEEEFQIDNVVVTGEMEQPTITYISPSTGTIIDTSTSSDDVVFTAEAIDNATSADEMEVQFCIESGCNSFRTADENSTDSIENPSGNTFTFTLSVQELMDNYGLSTGDPFSWYFYAKDQIGLTSAPTSGQQLQFGTVSTVTAVTNTNTGEMFDTLQEAHDDSDTNNGDTLVINEDLTTTSQVTITKSITIDGGGNTLDADFIKTNNSNNSAIGVQADNVAITNITVMSSGDQPWPDQLHGINVYQSTNVSVSYATIKDFYGTGIAYNGSTGSIQDVHTENNSWHGINVDKDGSNVSVTGNNTHDEPFADIYVDNDTLDVTVFAPAYDWERSGIPGRDNDRVYRLSPVVEACNSSIFDSGFVDGTIDSQNGWKSTGTFDEEITDNTYGYPELGCKVLRLSNGLTSNAFGNQTFSSPSTSGLAGEDVANDYFEAEFAFGSTEQSEQSGLALSISPDDGTGNRMSYLSLADTPTGTAVTFYDTNSTGGFVPTTLPELSRDVAHTVRFEIELVDGEANDVVRIYFDDSLVHTGTTWEQYYRYSSEQAGNGNIVPAIDRLLFRAAGTAVPSNVGGGYVFDNVSTTTDTTVIPDTTKPVVTIITPDADSYNPTEIRVLATDETSLYRVTANIYDESNSTFLHPCSQLTGDVVEHELVCPIPALADGVYTIRTNAQDNGDPRNTASTLSRQFTIDSTAPTISIDTPVVDDTYNSPLTVAGTATDNVSGVEEVAVYIRPLKPDTGNCGAFTLSMTVPVVSGEWTADFDTTVLEDGRYCVTVLASDLAGNSNGGGTHVKSFIVDNTDPTITVKDSSTGSAPMFSNVSFKLFDQYNIDKVEINGVVKDLTDNKWSDVNNVRPGVFGAVEGANTIVVFDVAGNTTSYDFTLDTVAPTTYFQIQPPSNVNGTFSTRLRAQGEADGTTIAKYIYFDSEAPENLCKENVSPNRNLDAVCDSSGLSEGEHTLYGVAIDQAGNRSDAVSDTFIVDRTDPTITVKAESVGTPNVFSTVSFKLFDEYKVDKLTLNGVEKDFTDNKWSDLNGVVPGRFGALEGENTLVLFDVTGNTTEYIFVLDTTAPAVTINTIDDGTDTTPTITGTVDDNDAVVTVSINGTDYAATNNGDGTWTLEVVDPLAVGDYTVQAFATDVAGNATDPVATDNFSVTEEPDTTDSSGGTGVLGDNTGDEDISTPTTGGIGGDNTPLLLASSNNNTFTTQGTSDEESEEESETSDEAEVLQSTTDESNADISSDDEDHNEDESGCFKILGICWYWWALPIVAIILYYGYRRFTEE